MEELPLRYCIQTLDIMELFLCGNPPEAQSFSGPHCLLSPGHLVKYSLADAALLSHLVLDGCKKTKMAGHWNLRKKKVKNLSSLSMGGSVVY